MNRRREGEGLEVSKVRRSNDGSRHQRLGRIQTNPTRRQARLDDWFRSPAAVGALRQSSWVSMRPCSRRASGWYRTANRLSSGLRQRPRRLKRNGNTMDSTALDFLKALLETPSPSGYEERIQAVVRKYVASFADEVTAACTAILMSIRNPGAKLRDAGRALRSNRFCRPAHRQRRLLVGFSPSAAGIRKY